MKYLDKVIFLALLTSLCGCVSTAGDKSTDQFALILIDQVRHRPVPIKLYFPPNPDRCSSNHLCPVAIISSGYGVSWFVLLISLTSIWYFVEHAGLDLESPTPKARALTDPSSINGQHIQRWVALAQARMPELAITVVYLPYDAGEPVILQGQWRAWLVRERTNAVYIDLSNNVVIGQSVAHAPKVGERLVHTADPLYFGTFAGLASKLIWLVFGLILTGLAGSGAYIYAKRTRLALREGCNLDAFNVLGRWKWPSLLSITALSAVIFVYW